MLRCWNQMDELGFSFEDDDPPETPEDEEDYPDDEIIEEDPPSDDECDRAAEEHFSNYDRDIERRNDREGSR